MDELPLTEMSLALYTWAGVALFQITTLLAQNKEWVWFCFALLVVVKPFNRRSLKEMVKVIEAKSRMVVVRGRGEGERGSCYSMSINFQLCKTDKV